jgi:superfamily I DNA/RNA helicase
VRVIPNAFALVEQEPEFMAEMIPDRLPSGASAGEWKLERGLMYVAMTRAEDELVLTRSGCSPFTGEIEAALPRVGK